MNLRDEIRAELWDSVKKPYEDKNYEDAITDAILYLTTVLREKTNSDLDGEKLVSKAFNGDNPVIRINKFQTTSEKDEQLGLSHIVRGIYVGIRNPRAHENIEDTAKSANALILLIDYVLGVIDQSKQKFTIGKFLTQVFDPAFVEKPEYALLITQEIPENKSLDTLIELFRQRDKGKPLVLQLVSGVIIDLLGKSDIEQFMEVVSEELRTQADESAIISAIAFLRPMMWDEIEEAPRMRIEHMVANSIEKGDMYQHVGELGRMCCHLFHMFSISEDIYEIVLKKLRSTDASERAETACWFVKPVLVSFKEPDPSRNFFVREFISILAESVFERDVNINQYVYGESGWLIEGWEDELQKAYTRIEKRGLEPPDGAYDIPF